MTRRFLVFALMTAALTALVHAPAPAAAEPAADPSADQIAERVQSFYDKTQTFKARFSQRYWIKLRNKTKNEGGTVIFQKPGKMSWRYTNANRVVSDGKLIRVYDAGNKQLYEQPLDKSQYPAALAFLVGGANLKQSFTLSTLDAKELKFSGGYVLLGVPKQPTAAYQKVLLYVDKKTFQVRRVLLLDAQGNRNRFDFDAPEVNVKVPANEFAYTPPPGTTPVRP